MALDPGTTANGYVNGVVWDARVQSGDRVGVCDCGGDLIGIATRLTGRRRWFDAQCVSCLREVSAPEEVSSPEPVPA